MSAQADTSDQPGVAVPAEAWAQLTEFPSPEDIHRAADLIVAFELERIAAGIDTVPDPAGDAWLRAETAGRRDVVRKLHARAAQLRQQ